MFLRIGSYVLNTDHIHSIWFNESETDPPWAIVTIENHTANDRNLHFTGKDAETLRDVFRPCKTHYYRNPPDPPSIDVTNVIGSVQFVGVRRAESSKP